MLCEITVGPGYLKADLFDRQTAEEERDALAAIAAEARKHACSQILISVHASRPLFKIEQYGFPDYFRDFGKILECRIALTGDSNELRLSSNTSSSLRDAGGSTCGAFPTKKRRSPGSGTVGGHGTGACDRSHGRDRSGASTHPDATWKASVRIQPDAFPPEGRPGPATLQGRPYAGRYVTTGSATGSRLFADRSIASVTSSVRRASRAVASAHGLPSARWSSQARVSLAIGPQKSPSAQSPGVPLCRNTMLTE